MSGVRLQNLSKTFGATAAVRDLSLEIADGEFFSILGPSGCGKSTTLRMIAGFEPPTRGTIFFNDREVTTLPPNQRNTGMVFQNYALFPHMTVAENVAFGLRARKMPNDQIRVRVKETLALLEMEEFLNRPVPQLSGGQQQRVALARALAVQPAILLLDEPLSNLDAQLRRSTRHELKQLQRRLGITTIYVTHDQEEALALSDRLLVMNDGEARQVGTPEEIYFSPANLFVMDFIGRSNVLDGHVVEASGQQIGVAGDEWRICSESFDRAVEWKVGAPVKIAFRPQDATIQKEAGEGLLPAQVHYAEFSGSFWEVEVLIGSAHCLVQLSPDTFQSLGIRGSIVSRHFWLHVPAHKLRLFPE